MSLGLITELLICVYLTRVEVLSNSLFYFSQITCAEFEQHAGCEGRQNP